jgi:hypothetical protein
VGRACSTHERREKVYRVLMGKPEGKGDLKDKVVDGRMVYRVMFCVV